MLIVDIYVDVSNKRVQYIFENNPVTRFKINGNRKSLT